MVAISLVSLLSACAPSYVDSRTPEVQKENLSNAMVNLYGEYTVKDSRNNDRDFTSVSIYPFNGSVVAEFSKQNGDTFKVYGGTECTGWYRESDKYSSIYCVNIDSGEHISMIDMRRIISPEKIPAGPGLFNYKAMTIESGYYLNYYLGNNGRPHIFSLEKNKSPPT